MTRITEVEEGSEGQGHFVLRRFLFQFDFFLFFCWLPMKTITIPHGLSCRRGTRCLTRFRRFRTVLLKLVLFSVYYNSHLIVYPILRIRHVPMQHHIVEVFVLILKENSKEKLWKKQTFISMSCGLLILIIFTAWKTSTSWSISIWSMHTFAPMYTPTRDTPLL